MRGRDIKRYGYDWANLWLIYIPWHFPYQFDDSIQGASEKAEKAFRKFSYLLVSNRDLRDPYFKELEKQGYSMVIDDADAMGGISKSPVIIFDRNKSLEFKEAKSINT